MRTIGRRRPRNVPAGDYPCLCDYCGTKWYRSRLTKQGSGFLACRLCEGDEHYARPPHIQNNEGTGSTYEPPVVRRHSQGHPVLL